MAGDIPAAQEGEAEQTAVGSIQKETSGTKEVSVFAAMKNEVLEMLECILAAFGKASSAADTGTEFKKR